MNPDPAQLSRIAAATGVDRAVQIVVLDRGFSAVHWLCPKHIELAKQQGWEVKELQPAPHELTCDWRNRGACS